MSIRRKLALWLYAELPPEASVIAELRAMRAQLALIAANAEKAAGLAQSAAKKLSQVTDDGQHLRADMVSRIHRGERIIPAANNQALCNSAAFDTVASYPVFAEQVNKVSDEIRKCAIFAFKSAENHDKGSADREFIEHGAACYFNCWGMVQALKDGTLLGGKTEGAGPYDWVNMIIPPDEKSADGSPPTLG